MKTLGLGILMVIGGFWLKSHYEPIAQVCNTGLGSLAQAFSSTANQDCSTAQNAVKAAPWLIGIGFTLAGGAVLAMLGFFTFIGLTGKQSPKPKQDA